MTLMRHLRVLFLPLLLGGCSAFAIPPSLEGQLPPAPGGTARIVVYRDVGVYEFADVLKVDFNGAKTADLGAGNLVYRDVAPGTYTVTFTPTRAVPDQFKSVPLAAGNVVYLKLVSFSEETCGAALAGGSGCRQHAYVTVFVDPQVAQREIQGLKLPEG